MGKFLEGIVDWLLPQRAPLLRSCNATPNADISESTMKGPKVYVCRMQNLQRSQLNSMAEAPKWAYFMSGILIVMSCLLGVTVVFVAFGLLGLLPQEVDIQMPMLFIVLPLSILILLSSFIMAVVLTRKRD